MLRAGNLPYGYIIFSGRVVQVYKALRSLVFKERVAYMSDTSSNPCRENLSLEPVVVMKDFRKENSTTKLNGCTYKMLCALCKTRGDPDTFFGGFCSVECAKTDEMFKNCPQYQKSSNGDIIETLSSPSSRHKRQCNSSTYRTCKSNDPSGSERPISPLQTRERRHSHQSSIQESSVSPKKQSEQNTGLDEAHGSKHNCIICGQETSNKVFCSRECKATNVRRIKLVKYARKCVVCNLLDCECHLPSNNVDNVSDKEQGRGSGLSSRKRERQADQIDSDDEDTDERSTTSKTFYTEKLRKRKQLPAKCRLRERVVRNCSSQKICDDDIQWTPANLPAWDELSDTCEPATNKIENESATPEIQVGNIRSVHHQNGDLSSPQMPPQQKKVIKSSPNDARIHGDLEQTLPQAQLQGRSGYRCDNDVTNDSAQCATHENFMQNSLDCSDSSEPESPSGRSPRRPGHLQWDANFHGRSPTIEKDFQRGFFFPQNSEIYRLHCEEMKSRIAVNQAKLMFFESELEKSRLEQKLLIRKLSCDKKRPYTGFQKSSPPPTVPSQVGGSSCGLIPGDR